MTNTPHELAEDFPGQADLIHDLKMKDGEFRYMAERYHEVNRAIHRAETNVEPVEELQEVQMRKERVALKDEIWSMVSADA